jgi:hypothetical protein
VGFALPLGAAALAALLLGAKLVVQQPSSEALAAGAAVSAHAAANTAPAPETLHLALPEPPRAVAAPAAAKPTAKSAPRKMATARKRELRSAPPASAAPEQHGEAESGGNGWVIRKR